MSSQLDSSYSDQLTPLCRPADKGVRTLDSQDLLQGQALVLIRYQDEVYRLQTTRQGKLILTK